MMNVVKYSDYETKSLEFEAPTNQKKNKPKIFYFLFIMELEVP